MSGIVVTLLAPALFVQAGSASYGSITGKVTTSEGEPLPFANVVMLGTEMGAMTDDWGRFEIKEIPPGEYNLKAAYLCYEPRTESVRVVAGRSLDLRFRLEMDLNCEHPSNPTWHGPPVEGLSLLHSSSEVQAIRIPQTFPGDRSWFGPPLSSTQIEVLEALLRDRADRYVDGEWVLVERQCDGSPMLAFRFKTEPGWGELQVDLHCMRYIVRTGWGHGFGNLDLERQTDFLNFALELFPEDPVLMGLRKTPQR